MTTQQIRKIRNQIKRRRLNSIVAYWARVLLFGVLLCFIIHSCAYAARPQGTHISRPAVVHHYYHDNKFDPVPYIAIGVITGVVIYAVFNKRCEHGLICKRF